MALHLTTKLNIRGT